MPTAAVLTAKLQARRRAARYTLRCSCRHRSASLRTCRLHFAELTVNEMTAMMAMLWLS